MTQSQSELEEIAKALKEEIDECIICHIPRTEHNRPNILHEFCGAGQQASLVARSQQSRDDQRRNHQGSNQVERTSSGSDAILRLALMRKGFIEVADLEQIEQELRISGKAGYAPSNPSSPDL